MQVRAARSLVFNTEITEEDEVTEKKASPRAPGPIPPAAKPQRPKPPTPETRGRPACFSVIFAFSAISVLNRRLRRCHAAGIARPTAAARDSSDRRVSAEVGVAASPPRKQDRPRPLCSLRSIGAGRMQLRDAEFHRAGAGVPVAVTVSVALVLPLRRPLAGGGGAQALGLQRHQSFGGEADHLAVAAPGRVGLRDATPTRGPPR